MPKKGEKPEEEKHVGITVKKSEDFSEWFTQVVTKSGLADYSTVSGCMVIRPLGMALWDNIRAVCEPRLKEMGIQNAYFPLFIPESLLKKEATHVEGFTPECAWVTHAGHTKLSEKLAVRPTSEAIMYDSYSKWIRSWRDLPLRLMQWNNVVRWEFKHPTLLIRTREFLWVEGHTAFATKEEADKEIRDIMALWTDVCQNTLALHPLHGKKTEKEKFAGAEATETLEFFVPNGKMAQGPDAHSDGQNFAKAYNITFLDEKGKKNFAWQNTWAITTRMIGVMVAVHSDDKGLVIPPKIAPNKVVVVPILFEDTKKEVLAVCRKLAGELKEFNPIVDDRDGYTPGWKFNEWELKGVPVRIEIGPKDLKAGEAVLVRRDTGEKKPVKLAEVKKAINTMLDSMQKDLLSKSRKMTEEGIVDVKTMDELINAIKSKKAARANFCNTIECEDWIKDKTEGAGTRGIIMDKKPAGKCVHCGKPARVVAYFAKAY
ncbi:MAG: proline--tRNA ligase [Candidatus Woesearchaeota archaeon]